MIIFDEYPVEQMVRLIKENKEHLDTGGSKLTSPLHKFGTIQFVGSVSKSRFENGDSKALFDTISRCAESNLPLPEWASVAIIAMNRKVMGIANKKENSWDHILGSKPFPNKKIANLKRRRDVRFDLWFEVGKLMYKSVPTDNRLFEEAGKKFAYGATTTKEIYYEIHNALERSTIGDARLKNEIWLQKHFGSNGIDDVPSFYNQYCCQYV